MWSFRFLNGSFFSRAREQWAPGTVVHDPQNVINLQGNNPDGVSIATTGDTTSVAAGAQPLTYIESVVTLGETTSAAAGTTPLASLSFDNTLDRLRTTAIPTSMGSYSIGGWVRYAVASGNPSLIAEFDGAGFAYGIAINGGALVVENLLGFANIMSSGALATDTWAFVGLTNNATSGFLFRGSETAQVGAGVAGTLPASAALTALSLGASASGFPLTGRMARWRVWDGVQLTQAQWEAERLADLAVLTGGLVADWQLRSDAEKLNDSSGTNHPLVTTGAGSWPAALGPMVVPPVTSTSAATTGDATSAGVGFFGVQNVTSTSVVTLGDVTSVATGAQAVTVASITTLGNTTSATYGDPAPAPLDFSTLMPHISLGKPLYGSGADIADFLDGGYGYTDESWAVGAASWAALNLGAGPSQILVALSHDNASGGSWITSSFEDYRIQVSNNSTNGADGTWTTVVTITGNNYRCREHLISFTGYSWVKLIVDASSQGQLDEFDVWDASNGTPDTFAFIGDSLTDTAIRRYEYVGGGIIPSFQDNVLTNQKGHYPLQVNLGATGQGAAYWATNIGTALSLHPDLKYWCINIGINDAPGMPAQLATFRTNLTTIINAILSAGKIPIVARTTWTASAGYGGSSSFEGSNLKFLNDDGINFVVNTLGVRRGPDLYSHFFSNGVAYNVVADPHPNETGYKAWTKAWADNLGIDPSAYGTTVKTLDSTTSVGTGTFTNVTSGTSAVTLAGTTSAASGSSTTGTSAQALANSTSAAAGASGAAGSSVRTLDASTSVSTGSSVVGSLANSTANTTSAGAGAAGGALGSSVRTLADSTSAASGSSATGTSVRTLANTTSVASGAHGVAGTSAQTLASTASAASGASGAAGTSAANTAATTSNASGSSTRGTAASTTAATTSAATGASGAAAASTLGLAATTSNASGSHTPSGVAGTSVQTLANTSSVAAGSSAVGSSARTLSNTTSAASAAHGAAGASAQTTASTASVASGSSVSGSATSTTGNTTSVALGTHSVTGSAASASANTTSVAVGAVGATGSATSTLEGTTSAGSGNFYSETTGVAASTTANTTSSATGSRGSVGSATTTTDSVTSSGSGTFFILVTGQAVSTTANTTSSASVDTTEYVRAAGEARGDVVMFAQLVRVISTERVPPQPLIQFAQRFRTKAPPKPPRPLKGRDPVR